MFKYFVELIRTQDEINNDKITTQAAIDTAVQTGTVNINNDAPGPAIDFYKDFSDIEDDDEEDIEENQYQSINFNP